MRGIVRRRWTWAPPYCAGGARGAGPAGTAGQGLWLVADVASQATSPLDAPHPAAGTTVPSLQALSHADARRCGRGVRHDRPDTPDVSSAPEVACFGSYRLRHRPWPGPPREDGGRRKFSGRYPAPNGAPHRQERPVAALERLQGCHEVATTRQWRMVLQISRFRAVHQSSPGTTLGAEDHRARLFRL